MASRYTAATIVGVIILLSGSVYAQDTTRAVIDRSSARQEVEEQVLTVISIIAAVERPSVAIVPRREKAAFGSMMFLDRSFERDLRMVPVKLLTLDEELESAKKIERLKKLLIKEK